MSRIGPLALIVALGLAVTGCAQDRTQEANESARTDARTDAQTDPTHPKIADEFIADPTVSKSTAQNRRHLFNIGITLFITLAANLPTEEGLTFNDFVRMAVNLLISTRGDVALSTARRASSAGMASAARRDGSS